MNREFISKKTRNALREVFVSCGTLREIDMEFEEAGIACERSYAPPADGARRSLVEQYYHTLNFSNADDANRFLVVAESVLKKTTRKLAEQPNNYGRQKLDDLIMAIKADGFGCDNDKIIPTAFETRKFFNQGPVCSISEVTRRGIADNMAVLKVNWSGRLSETDFLGRIFDLNTLPSTDNRYKTALDDIFKHRECNLDWDDNWVFSDGRFNLMESDEAFLSFLCEMVHPVVRPDDDEARKLVKLFNDYLVKDGWSIYEAESISGKPVFKPRQGMQTGSVVIKQVKALAERVDLAYISKQSTRMNESVEKDPELAIGTAKELVESVCKTILNERKVPFSKTADLTELNRATFKALRLMPDDIPAQAKGAETIKRILSNLASITQGLAELRGLYGTGHGKHGKTKAARPRHAKLTANASATLAMFLYETHLEHPLAGDVSTP